MWLTGFSLISSLLHHHYVCVSTRSIIPLGTTKCPYHHCEKKLSISASQTKRKMSIRP